MATIHPFASLLPPARLARQIADPPYDVVTTAETARMTAENPFGFLRVARADVEFPHGSDPYADAVYERAKQNYERLKREAPLTLDKAPALYVYRLEMAGHSQTGVVACVSVDEYEAGIVKRHENTVQVKEDDRTKHILTLRSQTGPVFMVYRDDSTIDALVGEAVTARPLFDFVAHADIRHTGWRVPADAAPALVDAFRQVPALYIADGHHRAASAKRARDELRARNAQHTGNEEYNAFLRVLFPAGQVQLLSYNRIVRDLNGLSPTPFLERLGKNFDVTLAGASLPKAPENIHMYLDGLWYCLDYRGSTATLSPVDKLGVSLLQKHVLGPVLGIDDPRAGERIDFVGGIRGTGQLERDVDSGAAAVAFAMHPVTVEQMMTIADAGQSMPPKSTWFEPKLRDGLFIHEI